MPKSGIELLTLRLEENCSHDFKIKSKKKKKNINFNILNSYNFFNES